MTTKQAAPPTFRWVTQYTQLDPCWVDDYEMIDGRLIVHLSENFSEVDEFEVEFLVKNTGKTLVFELPVYITDNGKQDFKSLCDICGFSNEEKPFLHQNL